MYEEEEICRYRDGDAGEDGVLGAVVSLVGEVTGEGGRHECWEGRANENKPGAKR